MSQEAPSSRSGKGCARWGCAILAVLVVAPMLFFGWPYRSEDVEAIVSANGTRCDISANQVSDWQERRIAPGIGAYDVAYPLEVHVFVANCTGLPGRRPHDVELIAADSGKVVGRGIACASRPVEQFPCRVEVPPILTRDASHRFILRLKRSPGEIATARIEIATKREWRSVVFDAIMSV